MKRHYKIIYQVHYKRNSETIRYLVKLYVLKKYYKCILNHTNVAISLNIEYFQV